MRNRAMVVALLAAGVLLPATRAAFAEESEFGVLPPQSVRYDVRIPGDGLWRAPQGSFVLADTIQVSGRKRAPRTFLATDQEPQSGQYRPRKDGALRFARGDAGKRITVAYQYRPRRIAVLPAVHGSEYGDVVPVLEETLAKELGRRGLVLVPADRVVDTLAEVGLRWPGPLPAEAAEKLAALARKLDVAYVLLPAVNASREVLFAGIQRIGDSTSVGTVSGTIVASGNVATVEGAASSGGAAGPYSLGGYKTTQSAAVGLLVAEGSSGRFLAAPADSRRKSVWIRIGNRQARRSLVRQLAESVVAQWREAG